MGKFRGIPPTYPFAQPGDVIFTQGQDLLQKAIRWAERSHGESKSWCNHTGLVTRPGYLVPPDCREQNLAWVSEALWHVENHNWFEYHEENQGYSVAVFRPYGVSGKHIRAIVANAESRTGDRYAWWRLFGFLGERLTGGLVPFTKLFFLKERNVCSNHVALAMIEGGVWFGQQPFELDPDEMMDYCMAHPDEFRFVGWSVIPAMM
jgi:hypothetical protein